MIIPKDILVENIKRDILDNSVGAVSPQDIRRNLLDIIDSVSLLTEYGELNALNFSTADTRTTRVGQETLSKRKAVGYRSIDNVAVGYAALASQIDAKQNTAVGAYSLTCNMYGEDNVGAGFHALGSTINGFGNVGVGSYSLNNNKEGNFNIAIGHGAGYYVQRDVDYQFFVAAHPVDTDYICANTSGVGLTPLLIGDLSNDNLRLGVGVRTLHSGATLQVGGNIFPHVTSQYNLGSNTYRFNNLYLHSSIFYPNGNSFVFNGTQFYLNNSLDLTGSLDVTSNVDIGGSSTVEGKLTAGTIDVNGRVYASGHILPRKDVVFNLGDNRERWLNVHAYNLTCDGVGYFTKFQAQEQEHYRHKTIFLASTGDITVIDGGGASGLYDTFTPNNSTKVPEAYLLDEELNGAGFQIGASGLDYYRFYEFTFRSRESDWNYLSLDNPFSRSSWFSNISLQTASGCHIKSDRLINKDKVAMLTYADGLGLLIDSGNVYLANQYNTVNTLSSDTNVNFIAPSGDIEDYIFSLKSAQSGVNLYQRFLTYTSNFNLDNDNKERIDGFQIGYVCDSELKPPNFFNEQVGQNPNRFIISSYNNTSFAKRCFTLMQDGTEGYVGISNFDYSESMLPDTVFNIRTTGNAIARITAENNSDTEAGIQLLGAENCLHYGISMSYIKNSGTFSIKSYNDGLVNDVITIDDETGYVNILNKNMNTGSMLTVGDEDHTEAFIALFESSGVPVATSGYAQLFVRNTTDLDSQSSILSFMDSSGNVFSVDVTSSSVDGSVTDKPLGLDNLGNTFGGIRSPKLRANITSNTVRNTAIGYEALSELLTGVDNSAFGYQAGKNITTGTKNVLLGSSNGLSITTQSRNILIGTNLLETGDYNGELVIGHDNSPLVEGKLIGTKYLGINGYLQLKESVSKYTNIDRNYILVKDNESQYGASSFVVKFSGSNDQENILITLNHNNAPMSVQENFASSSRPYAQINGDVRVKGSIRFANNTSIDNANFLTNISNIESDISDINTTITVNQNAFTNLKNAFDNLIIEGIVESEIRFADLPTSFNDDPLTFYIRKKVISNNRLVNAPAGSINENLIQIVLRDPYISIRKGDYVIAMKVNGEYRPVSITGAP